MTRQHATLSSIVRRLRPSPERFAAAAALQDPNLMLQLRRDYRLATTSSCPAR
jgi:hypothetical protein